VPVHIAALANHQQRRSCGQLYPGHDDRKSKRHASIQHAGHGRHQNGHRPGERHLRLHDRTATLPEVNLRAMQAMRLYAANSMFVSDYLTTPGQKAKEDFRMIADLGFEITAGDYESSKLLDLWNKS